jgi:hypothetical protein
VKPLDVMSMDELRAFMKWLSRSIEDLLPNSPHECDFALVLTTKKGKTHYVSNSRGPMPKALRKTAERLELKRSSRSGALKPPQPLGA